jgi:hypothetical protein
MKSGSRLFYSMVGNPTACIDSCTPGENLVAPPNGDAAVDGMISVIAHELVEAVSDPQSDGNRAWEDDDGYENADKCAWTYGETERTDTGSMYNMEFNGRKWLVQRNVSFHACCMLYERLK